MTARELRLIAEAASMAFLATRIYLTDFPIAFIMWSFIGAVFALTFFLSSLATACAAGAATPVVVFLLTTWGQFRALREHERPWIPAERKSDEE